MYDVTWCGGVTEAKKIAAMADAYSIPTLFKKSGASVVMISC
jgi:L-alanine-DL-glutamate epimerase-like enolase superfamily enzyme